MRVVRSLARGGFGRVDEVELDDGTRLARKTFDPAPGPTDRQLLLKRFNREVRIQKALDHPNIMPILDAENGPAPTWFTMPLATKSLEEKIREDHAAGVPFDMSVWQDILGAVAELHRLGFVHRDLKPANILLVGDTWRISDFGLILPLTRDTTTLSRTGSAFGSINYQAPEQISDFANTPQQADIYALGCILHDAVVARPARTPFGQIRDAGQFGPILEKCTEIDYTRRFPTVAHLRGALFDLRSTADLAATGETDLLQAVMQAPQSADLWRRLLQRLEGLQATDQERHSLLRGLKSDLLVALQAVDEVLFSRLVTLICDWVVGTAFTWSYCDVVGDRLAEAYRVGSVRVRCQVVLAALELAVSHNRWHVMQQVGTMLGQSADDGLVDRILIEAGLEPSIGRNLRRIEKIIHWPRSRWHERIGSRLDLEDALEAF